APGGRLSLRAWSVRKSIRSGFRLLGRVLRSTNQRVNRGLWWANSLGRKKREDSYSLVKQAFNHYRTGQYDNAIACFTRALETAPNDPDTLYWRGPPYQPGALYHQGRAGSALASRLLHSGGPRNLAQ